MKLAGKEQNLPGSLKLFPWTTVLELKKQLAERLKVSFREQKLFHGNVELPDTQTLTDCGIYEIEKLAKGLTVECTASEPCYIRSCPSLIDSPSINAAIDCIQTAFKLGASPVLAADGTGGTYQLTNSTKRSLAIFKPLDEEAFAPANPRGFVASLDSPGFRPGVLSGESGYREAAVFMLDHGHFSGVPETTLVESMHKSYASSSAKLGSLQLFVPNEGCAEDYSFSKFSVEQVQRIAVLDIRILNMDRNVANLLVTKDFQLVPIDHGLSIPDCFEVCQEDLCWMDWPQAKAPLSAACLEYVAKLDPRSDIELIEHAIPFRDTCLKNIRVSGLFLKSAVAQGLTLHEIGKMLYRIDAQTPSLVEVALQKAEEFYHSSKPGPARVSLRALGRHHTRVDRWLQEPQEPQRTNPPEFLEEQLASVGSTDSEDTILFSIPELDEEAAEATTVRSPFWKSKSLTGKKADHPRGGNQAFDDKLFRVIEAFLDQAIQQHIRRRKRVDGSLTRPRSHCGSFYIYE